MDDQPRDTDVVVSVLGGHDPTNIGDAFDVHTRIDAVIGWLNERKGHVRGWLTDRAETRRTEDGAAPRWQLDGGTVTLTDPKPIPRLADPDTFARWVVTDLLDDDPDADPNDAVVEYRPHKGDPANPAGPFVIRRTRELRPDPGALERFFDTVMANGDTDTRAHAAAELVDDIDDAHTWILPDDLLDRILTLTVPDGRPRFVATKGADGWQLVDRDTGSIVPGTTVTPPGTRTIQVRPTTDHKNAVRQQLDTLIGPPTLSTGDDAR